MLVRTIVVATRDEERGSVPDPSGCGRDDFVVLREEKFLHLM